MLDRQHGKIVFECDSCGEVFNTDTGDFHDAIVYLNAREWQFKYIAKIWCHYCRKCKDQPPKERTPELDFG